MANRSELLKVRVTPDEKEAILDYMEESREASTISDIGRILILRAIRDDGEDDGASIDPEELVEPMEVALSGVDDQLTNLSNRIASVESKVRSDDEIDKLARDIFYSLPEHESGEEFDEVESFHIADADENLDRAQYASTPRAWSRWFGRDIGEVRAACARMLDYYPDAKFVHEEYEHEYGYTVQSPERRYYRVPE